MAEPRLEPGSTIALPKQQLDALLARLRGMGFQTIGPRIHDAAVGYAPIVGLEDLPQGYTSEQDAGHYRLVESGHSRYFDITPGPQTWKQFLFPPRAELLRANKKTAWELEALLPSIQPLAFIGVRGCELAAISIQDRVFIRDDFTDPHYHARRQAIFILSADCLHPGGTCFCVSMDTGPKVKAGFDLNLTELEDVFLLQIGSELGVHALEGLSTQPASAFLLQAAQKGIARATQRMGRALDTSDLPNLLLKNPEHPHWNDVARRCLSCASCTLVCPTCFCWDALDHTSLDANTTERERVWDSCFNPGFSSQAGGNMRPTTRSRYRQWLTHKFGSWKLQFDTLGCVGCGRCITWCPVGIDVTVEIPALRKEARQ
jgi:sulfhydrogenase subunit beta (sulfur reductase)